MCIGIVWEVCSIHEFRICYNNTIALNICFLIPYEERCDIGDPENDFHKKYFYLVFVQSVQRGNTLAVRMQAICLSKVASHGKNSEQMLSLSIFYFLVNIFEPMP